MLREHSDWCESGTFETTAMARARADHDGNKMMSMMGKA